MGIFKYKFPSEMKKENYGERNTEIEKDIKRYLCSDEFICNYR